MGGSLIQFFDGYGSDSITLKELLPIVFAFAVWGHCWRNSSVTVLCDNQGAVAVINSGYSKAQSMMHLLRCLFFIRARYNISLWVVYLPGKQNILADAICRDHLSTLFSQVPSARMNRTRLACAQPARLDVSSLDAVVRRLFSAGIATTTRKAYNSGVNRYNRFCILYNLSPFPTSECGLCYFVAYLFQEGLAAITIKGYLSAVRHAQIACSLGDPKIGEMPQLEYFIKGVRNWRVVDGNLDCPLLLICCDCSGILGNLLHIASTPICYGLHLVYAFLASSVQGR